MYSQQAKLLITVHNPIYSMNSLLAFPSDWEVINFCYCSSLLHIYRHMHCAWDTVRVTIYLHTLGALYTVHAQQHTCMYSVCVCELCGVGMA